MHHEEGGFNAGSVLLSFLLGGLVGAGLAFLLAPQSGPETRKKIRELADDVTEKTTGYVSQAKEKVSQTIDKGKEVLEEQKSALTSALDAGKQAYEKEVQK